MFVFDITLMLAIILFANIMPGIIAGISILRGVKQLELLEKAIIGGAMGFLFPQLVPFLLSFVGIQYSYTITLASVALAYILAIALFFLSYKADDLQKAFSGIGKIEFSVSNVVPVLFSMALVVLLFFTFSVRFQTISPVYQELDPYFYSYGAIFIMEQGSVPLHDSLAWWPLNSSGHRSMPSLIYLESNWYSLYTHGNMASVDSYLLAEISNFYPPLAAMFTIFFVYLLFRIGFSREIGLAIAALLAFMPSYLYKTLSGVFEAQPMSFLLYAAALALIYAFLVYKDRKILIPFSVIAFSAMLGSTGATVASTLMAIILSATIAMNFIRYWINDGKEEKPKQDNETYLVVSGVLAVVFVAFSFILDYYSDENITISTVKSAILVVIPLIMAFLMRMVYERKDLFGALRKNEYAIYGAVFVAFILIMASPLGSVVTDYAKSGFGAGNYNTPLERTIAEQQLSDNDLAGELSALGTTIKIPLVENILEFTSQIVNFIYTTIIQVVNAALGLNLPPIAKNPSIASIAILGFMFLTLFEIGRFIVEKKHEVPILLILIAVMFYPLSISGMIKAKYTIYFTFAFVLMLGYFIGRLYMILNSRLGKYAETNGINMAKPVVFVLVFALFISPIVFSPSSISLGTYSLNPEKFADNPKEYVAKAKTLCATLGNDPNNKVCQFSSDPDSFLSRIENQYSPELCYYMFLYDEAISKKADDAKSYVAGLRCSVMTDYWLNSLEWMKANLPDDARVTSWWDYGHWTNYFSRKASVIRNEHANLYMIQDIAHALIMANETETREIMEKYGSEYLMIDSEIIMSPDSIFGAKFYALNYLACSRDNLTNVLIPQMASQCEYENLWEEIGLTSKKCLVSSISNKWGVVAKRRSITSENGLVKSTGVVDAYCVANVTLADGSEIRGTYYLDRKTPSGELMLNRGLMYPTSGGSYVMLYTNQKIWNVDGQTVDGYGDRIGKGRFYDSMVYKGFVLDRLDGFGKIFDNGNVKIYKLVK